jgi:hypothetical protein
LVTAYERVREVSLPPPRPVRQDQVMLRSSVTRTSGVSFSTSPARRS